MRSWDDFLGHFGSVFLFIGLQLMCLYIIVQFNDRQQNIFNHTALLLSSNLDQRFSQWNAYFNLEDESERLHAENARLRTQLRRMELQQTESKNSLGRSSTDSNFIYHSTQIISNQKGSRYNQLIINAGLSDSLSEGRAIIGENGIVGQTAYCSDNFCSVIPIIHVQSAVSASILGVDYFGQLRWDGRDIRFAQLEGIPQHVHLEKGDTIVTSGYSTIFPPGEPIGQIDEVELPQGSNFYKLQIKLNVDFGRLKKVYWVENLNRKEIISVKKSQRYDQD